MRMPMAPRENSAAEPSHSSGGDAQSRGAMSAVVSELFAPSANPAIARRILEHLSLPANGPPRFGPHPPPQCELLDWLQRPAFI